MFWICSAACCSPLIVIDSIRWLPMESECKGSIETSGTKWQPIPWMPFHGQELGILGTSGSEGENKAEEGGFSSGFEDAVMRQGKIFCPAFRPVERNPLQIATRMALLRVNPAISLCTTTQAFSSC